MVITVTIILLILSQIVMQSGVLYINPSSPSTIQHPTPYPSPDCDAKWCVYYTHRVYQAATQAGRDQWTSYQTTSTPTHFDKGSPSHHHHLHRLYHKLFSAPNRFR